MSPLLQYAFAEWGLSARAHHNLRTALVNSSDLVRILRVERSLASFMVASGYWAVG